VLRVCEEAIGKERNGWDLSMFYVLATEVRRRTRRTGRSSIASSSWWLHPIRRVSHSHPDQEKCLTGMGVPSAALAIGYV
jgi:hypothetical protein